MDNAQKAIMIGVGLFITIIIIAAVMLITGMGQDLLSGGQQQVSSISTSLQAQLTADFDGTEMTGSKVIAAVKRYYKEDMDLTVVNGTNSTKYGRIQATITGGKVTGFTKLDNPEPVGSLTNTSSNATSATYVASTAKYKAELIKIEGTENVIGITFTRI